MFGNKRKEFNARVSLLFPGFGFTLDDAGIFQTLSALDLAWERKYNDYESALFCAYLTYGGMLKTNDERKLSTLEKIKFIEQDWLNKSVIAKPLVAQWRDKATEWEGKYNESEQEDDFELTGNMPDITKSSLLDRFFIPENRQMLLFGHCKTVAESFSNQRMPIDYLYVLAVIESDNLPLLFVTLERGITGTVVLGVFHRNGIRENLGDGNEYHSLSKFKAVALDIASDRLNFELNDVIQD